MKRIEVDDDVKALLEKAVGARETYMVLYAKVQDQPLQVFSGSEILREALQQSIDEDYEAIADLARAEIVGGQDA